jgi:hypothetical protein
MNYILITLIILLIFVIVSLWIYKKRPIIIKNYKEFTLDNMSYKADIINNFYAISSGKVMRFQTKSLRLIRDGDTGKYIIEDIQATCIEGEDKGSTDYFTDEDRIYMTKSDLINDLR